MRAPPGPAHGWKALLETLPSRPPAAVGACARGQTRMRRARCAARGSQTAQAADTAASRKEGHPAVGSGPAPVARRPHVSAESNEAARGTWTVMCPWISGPPAGLSLHLTPRPCRECADSAQTGVFRRRHLPRLGPPSPMPSRISAPPHRARELTSVSFLVPQIALALVVLVAI